MSMASGQSYPGMAKAFRTAERECNLAMRVFVATAAAKKLIVCGFVLGLATNVANEFGDGRRAGVGFLPTFPSV